MKKINLDTVKSKAKQYAPAIIAGVAVGATVATIVVERKYNPKDKIAIQMPKGVMTKMRDEGKGIAINSNEGWFTLKYVPND